MRIGIDLDDLFSTCTSKFEINRSGRVFKSAVRLHGLRLVSIDYQFCVSDA